MAATLDEEREALNRIKKILDDLGEHSCVGAAFDESIFELAADNIGNNIRRTAASLITEKDCVIDEQRRVIKIKNATITDAQTTIWIQRGTIDDLEKNIETLKEMNSRQDKHINDYQLLDKVQDYLMGQDEDLGNDLQTMLDRMTEDSFNVEMDGAKAARQICKIQRQINEVNILLEQVGDALLRMSDD